MSNTNKPLKTDEIRKIANEIWEKRAELCIENKGYPDISFGYLCFIEYVTKGCFNMDEEKVTITEISEYVTSKIQNGGYELEDESKELLLEFSKNIFKYTNASIDLKKWFEKKEQIRKQDYMQIYKECISIWHDHREVMNELGQNDDCLDEEGYPCLMKKVIVALYPLIQNMQPNRKRTLSLESSYRFDYIDDNIEEFTIELAWIEDKCADYVLGKRARVMNYTLGEICEEMEKENRYDLIYNFSALTEGLRDSDLGLEDDSKNNPKQKPYFNFLFTGVDALSSKGKAFVGFPSEELCNEREGNRKFIEEFVSKGNVEAVIFIDNNSFVDEAYSGHDTLVVFSKNNKKVKYARLSELFVDNQFTNNWSSASLEDIKSINYKLDYFSLRYTNPKLFKFKTIDELVINPKKDIFRGCQLLYGKKNKEKKISLGVREVTIKDLEEDNDLESSCMDIKWTTQKNKEKYLLHYNDVLITMKYSAFKAKVVSFRILEGDFAFSEYLYKFVPSGNLMVIRLDTTKIDPYYIVAYLNSFEGRKQISCYETGASQKSLTRDIVGKIRIPIKDKKEMQKIANEYKESIAKIKDYKQKIKHEMISRKEKHNRCFNF